MVEALYPYPCPGDLDASTCAYYPRHTYRSNPAYQKLITTSDLPVYVNGHHIGTWKEGKVVPERNFAVVDGPIGWSEIVHRL